MARTAVRTRGTVSSYALTISRVGLERAARASDYWPDSAMGKIGKCGTADRLYPEDAQVLHGHLSQADALATWAHQRLETVCPVKDPSIAAVAILGVAAGRVPLLMMPVITSMLVPPLRTLVAGFRLVSIAIKAATGVGPVGPSSTPTIEPLPNSCAVLRRAVGRAARAQGKAADARAAASRAAALALPRSAVIVSLVDGMKKSQATGVRVVSRAVSKFEGGISRLGRRLRACSSTTDGS